MCSSMAAAAPRTVKSAVALAAISLGFWLIEEDAHVSDERQRVGGRWLYRLSRHASARDFDETLN